MFQSANDEEEPFRDELTAYMSHKVLVWQYPYLTNSFINSYLKRHIMCRNLFDQIWHNTFPLSCYQLLPNDWYWEVYDLKRHIICYEFSQSSWFIYHSPICFER